MFWKTSHKPVRDIPSTEAFRRALRAAKAAANRRGDSHVRAEHVLLALLDEATAPRATGALRALGVAPERLRAVLAPASDSGSVERQELPWDGRAKAVLERTIAEVRRSDRCTTAELLIGVATGRAGLAAELLRWQGVAPERLRAAAAALPENLES